MQLLRLSIDGFRSLVGLQDISFHRLTVFIGENDAGKTAILDALEILLTSKGLVDGDYHRLGEIRATDCTLTGRFSICSDDLIPEDMRVAGANEFELRKTITPQGARYQVNGLGFADSRWNDFERLDAPTQKELLAGLGVAPGTNATQRVGQCDTAIKGGVLQKSPQWRDVAPSLALAYLPRFERVSSADYKQPDSMIQRIMQSVVHDCLKPVDPATGERALIQELGPIDIKVRAALNAKAEEMQAILKTANPRILRVEIAPAIDYAKAVTTTSLMMDAGSGLRSVSAHGEGSKKRLWMGLLEWERRAQRQVINMPLIRVYDEPDVNLDYAAERQLFASILEDAAATDTKTQVVVCTHTMTLIDRAPADAINLLVVDENDLRRIERLNGDADDDVRDFIASVSRSVGLSNSALFYERAFLLVEGESEESALPILYRSLYKRSMVEDGIVLVNLFSCSAWKGLLKVLLINRASVTTMLLDQDCRNADSSGYITETSLSELGYPQDFVASSCFFVGAKEFEDAFATEDMVAALSTHWPRPGGSDWTVAEIDALRGGDKFSSELIQLIRQTCETTRRSSARKPAFAARLAEQSVNPVQIPGMIREAFRNARRKAGIEEADLADGALSLGPILHVT